MAIGNILRIENNTAKPLGLPPTNSFPAGLRLVPGLNTVPVKYMQELDELEVDAQYPGKKPFKRSPGRELISMLQEPVVIVTEAGKRRGPQITVFTDDQAGRPDGPPAPEDLLDLRPEAAVKIIEVTDNREDLKRWQKKDQRKIVLEAITRKLG